MDHAQRLGIQPPRALHRTTLKTNDLARETVGLHPAITANRDSSPE
jgi:hypothetical protein